jgi:hypothetical protein
VLEILELEENVAEPVLHTEIVFVDVRFGLELSETLLVGENVVVLEPIFVRLDSIELRGL